MINKCGRRGSLFYKIAFVKQNIICISPKFRRPGVQVLLSWWGRYTEFLDSWPGVRPATSVHRIWLPALLPGSLHRLVACYLAAESTAITLCLCACPGTPGMLTLDRDTGDNRLGEVRGPEQRLANNADESEPQTPD